MRTTIMKSKYRPRLYIGNTPLDDPDKLTYELMCFLAELY